MQYGYFDDKNKEYVITTPETPYPWINYLGNEDFFTLISNTGGGYSFYKDALLRRLTRYRYNNSTLDNNGKYYYIKDGEDIWNPGWKPIKNTLDAYTCSHGLGYTRIRGEKNNLDVEVLAFVPLNFTGEINQLILTNKSQIKKEIDFFSLVEFCLWNAWEDMTNFQRTFSIGRTEADQSSILHFTDYRNRRNHFAFFSVNQDIDGFDCDKEAFTGTHNGFESPAVVISGKSANSLAYGWSPIGSHHLHFKLNPSEEKVIIFILGYVENSHDKKWSANGEINKEKMYAMQNQYATTKDVNQGLADLRAYWDDLLGVYQAKTGIEQTDRMINIWNPYQCMVTFNISRSASYFESGIGRGLGFRDSNQDMLGFVHLVPERARQRLIDLASTQLTDGGAYHQYQPLTKKGNHDIGSGFNDDPLWLICGVIAYLKETGDFSILEESIPFDNNPEDAATMFEHLKRSFYFTINHLGPHGLPLIGRADWNDCLNLNSYNDNPDQSFQTSEMKRDGRIAESLMIAGAFVFFGKHFADLCSYIGKEYEEQETRKHIEIMVSNVKKYGWDGKWFLRAYDANGCAVGSKENEEGKIFIESQGLCSMAAIGLEEGYVEKSLSSVKQYLDCEYGIILQNPAFTKYKIEYGEISTYIEGYKENAGIFCHNNPWIMIAETILGRGDAAYSYWKKIAPAHLEEISEIHRTEPYVYAQMIAGKDAFRPGEAKNSWLTGTAAWNYVAISQYILGIQPDYDALVINPCIPSLWDGFTVTRIFRGVEYTISIKNPQHVSKGVAQIILDGKSMDSNRIPILNRNSKHAVEVILGKVSE